MKKIEQIIKWFIVGVSIGILIFIGYSSYQSSKKPDKIVLVSKSIQSEYVFWETIRMGAQLAAKEEEIPFEYVGPLEEKDVDKQVEIMNSKIEEGADIILLAAADKERLALSVENAKKKGITLVSVDSSVVGQTEIVATDNVAAAQELTHYLLESINNEGEVIMLNFVQGASTAHEREQGYDLVMAGQDKVKQLPTVYTEGTTESAYKKAKEIIKQYPNLKGIVGANQYMTEGICLAIEELGLSKKIKVVGFDSSNVIIEALEKGIIEAILVQKPFNMGYLGVKVAVDLFDGKKVEQDTDTGYKLITADTLYDTENQKLLYPIIR
ncbi:MAG: substrate-binding domain-containing protein [Zhenhengia sp.]|uniref:substrate-binding domain-containing protein n=1 Tax=Zhenhengia sp. TaxID=2944208 RepID=UPI0029130F6E|nr:substrate-binding domain-containing protein [Clostridiales bacterium]MDU6974620.1 substrate-binding domain-containing protein [Clostridiales bacterium]